MSFPCSRLVVAVAALATNVCFPAPVVAGNGAGELSLDRGAVAALVDLQLPGAIRAGLPGGLAGIRIERAGPVDFRDGAVELPVRVSAPVAGVSVTLRVRYRPVVDRGSGTVRLVPSVAGGTGPALPFDAASLLPSVSLPRIVRQEVPGGPTGRASLAMTLQGVRVDEHRVVVSFGLATRPLPSREE